MAKNTNQSLFAGQEETFNIGGANQLTKTAQLTNTSEAVANKILTIVIADQETYSAKVSASQSSHDEMDKLIVELGDLQSIDVDFLKEETDEIQDKMLKSQQSKRSRAKSKVMTQENYTSMMTAAIAEYLLREAMGKPKGAGGGYSNSGDPTYTDEELADLMNNPELLTKAIRNVQSKKSIAKSKMDFDPESDRWKSLLIAEQQLKDARSQISGFVDRKSQAAVSMLEDVNVDEMSDADAKEQLAKLKELLAGK